MDDITWVRAVANDYALVRLSTEQAVEVMKSPRVASELAHRDTLTRERITDFLAQKILGRPWPTYGDGEEVANAFYRDFREAAKKCGYDVVPDLEYAD